MINLWSGFLIPPYLMGWGTSPPTRVIPRSRRCYRGVNLLGVERDANTRLKPAPPKSCLAPSADPFDVGFTSKKRVVSKRTVSETAYHYRSTRTGRSPPYDCVVLPIWDLNKVSLLAIQYACTFHPIGPEGEMRNQQQY
jgi:hypothetical protein